MALDLGIINIAAGYISNGSSFIIPGGELLALDRYFHKEKARCTNSKSRKCRLLNRKWGRQRKHYLHVLTKHLVNAAQANGVSVIVVGKVNYPSLRFAQEGASKSKSKVTELPGS